MMGKPCTYCTLYNVRYINDGKTMPLYVISIWENHAYVVRYNVRYINDGKTMHIRYIMYVISMMGKPCI